MAALEMLPAAIDRIVALYVAGAIPADAHSSQLFYDNNSASWAVLFIPTNDGFGHHIDRYIDLIDGTVHLVIDNNEFVRLFQPFAVDKLKFLVTPFPDVRRTP